MEEHLDSCIKEKPVKKKETVNKDSNGDGTTKDTPSGEIAVMPAKSKKRKHDDGIRTLRKSECVNGRKC
jgi:hypothetical protein